MTFKPSRSDGPSAHLTVQFDGPRYGDGPEGRLMVFSRSGAVSVKTYKLNRDGDGSLRVGFGLGTALAGADPEPEAGTVVDVQACALPGCPGPTASQVWAHRLEVHGDAAPAHGGSFREQRGQPGRAWRDGCR